jgi:dihydrofolate reductase
MLLLGSGTLTSALAEHGLIDEYQFAVAPVMLGQGRNLISGVTRTSKMSLTESRALPQGNLLLRYDSAD